MSASNALWQMLPGWIPSFLGHAASHSVWERRLAADPVNAFSPQWQQIEEAVLQSHSAAASTAGAGAGADADVDGDIDTGADSKADDQANAQWGLQSVTLHTNASSVSNAPWAGPWPEQLPGDKAKLGHIKACFGDPLIQDQNLAIYQVQSPQAMDWVAQCMLTPQGFLQNLTLVRMHAWQPLIDVAPKFIASAFETSSSNSSFFAPCAARSMAPSSGWYEGGLPSNHRLHTFFAGSDVRLVYRVQGERFPTLGVQPSEDEELVQWRWMRAE